MKIGSKLQLSPFYQIVSEENSKLYETVYELINVFVTQQFRSFRRLLLRLLLVSCKIVVTLVTQGLPSSFVSRPVG